MWHRRKIREVVKAEPFYVTPEDTYHQLRSQRLRGFRKFFGISSVPFLTKVRRRISLWNVQDELQQLVARKQLELYQHGNILFKL